MPKHNYKKTVHMRKVDARRKAQGKLSQKAAKAKHKADQCAILAKMEYKHGSVRKMKRYEEKRKKYLQQYEDYITQLQQL